MSVATGADRPVPERSVIVTVGEGLLRLTPPGSARLPGAHALQVHVGGAEANVAAGLATLGVPARWFSRVAANPTGDALLRPLTALGVDVRDVVRAPGRTGLVLVEDGAGVRPTRVTYDRADSTFTQLHPSDLGEARLERLLGDAAWLHLTGIDLTVADAPLHALQVLWDDAGRRGVRRSFDVNLRSTLPDAGRLAERAAPYLAQADLVFLAERDARSLSFVGAGPAGDEEEPHRALARLASAGAGATWVLTRGAEGAMARTPDGTIASRPALPAEGPGRIGRGDAFAAGFLSRWRRASEAPASEADLTEALAWGVAAASYKASLAGDLPELDPGAVADLASGQVAQLLR